MPTLDIYLNSHFLPFHSKWDPHIQETTMGEAPWRDGRSLTNV